MINNASGVVKPVVELNYVDKDGLDLLASQIVPREKAKDQPKNHPNASRIPQSNPNRNTYLNNSVNSVPLECYNRYPGDTFQTKEFKPDKSRERINVQQPPTYTVPSNRWNYQTFRNTSADSKQGIPKNNANNNSNEHESAFIERNKSVNIESNNNNNASSKNKNLKLGDNTVGSDRHVMPPIHRTEDQENAFRRIEDVHNYAKLNHYVYSHGSSNSSVHEEEEEEDDDNDDDLMEHDVLVSHDDTDINYENYFFKKNQSKKSPADRGRARNETEVANVDVEAVQGDQEEFVNQTTTAPDHHARRPMNAFLIFCKRHRAIVKEKYKSLENRAITKILGDWWASLDANDKKSYTNLAQQNKDAFFSANPNFKWYKLPAPPLRTLSTRPGNTDRLPEQEAYDATKKLMSETTSQQYGRSSGQNYFKLADEAQMGDLSSLMKNKMKDNHEVLQQTLSDTTDFFNAHFQNSDNASSVVYANSFKRRLQDGNSFSSTSSEDDSVPKQKTSRSCKGKIYQELINSGQITAVTKKFKQPKVQQYTQQHDEYSGMHRDYSTTASALRSPTDDSSEHNQTDDIELKTEARTVSECDSLQHYESLAIFDLDEKIKELPALSLESYLQQKRSTKKKKKLSSRKRNSNSCSSNKSSTSTQVYSPPPKTQLAVAQSAPTPAPAVGSQKRKARKESITRRDVNTIEEEVASLLPLPTDFTTINGCYYYNKPPTQHTVTSVSTCATTPTALNTLGNGASAPSPFNNVRSSPTSDLLILAEVAANRTELINQ